MSADLIERLQSVENNPYQAMRHMHELVQLAGEAAAEIGRLRGEAEQLRVHLAGCGVIAMCNTRESLAKQMPERGAYGWSVSLEDCRNAVEREMALRERLESTAPAMPNGVEADLSAQLDAMTAAYERRTAYTIVHKGQLVYMSDLGRAAYSDVVAERDAALRAADNRDAAGVCNCASGRGSEHCVVHASNDVLHRMDRMDAPAAVPAGEAVAVCGTCNGVGMIGGHRGQTPDSFEQWAEDCPDCTPQRADGEASMFAGQSDAQIAHAVRMAEQHYRSLGRDPVYCNVSLSVLRDCTPPAPVQAAPQEGEAYRPVRFGGIRRPSDEALAAAFWEHRQRENSLPADLCDSKLVKFGNDIVQRARELAPYLAAHPSACELGAVRALIERWHGWIGQYDTGDAAIRDCIEELENTLRVRPSALQHRGDSRGGEGS